jgi:putative DNA methylase
MKKKLIEVALPLEAINKESAREKSIRHGHPSTLHLWWARRPLAACRAVLFASLVDDPSSLPEQFPTEADQDKERQRLFRLIEKLVLWENANNRAVLDEAHAEILKSTGGNPPPIYDPFCGGGSIPLEAQRLGLEAYGSDLNPVAVLITKALIEIPPKFAGRAPVNPASKKKMSGKGMWVGARGLADDIRYYGQWMRDRAVERIGYLYPKVEVPKEQGGGESTVVAWLWARTVVCPNPACGARMPLVKSFALSTKAARKSWAEPVVDHELKTITFTVKSGSGRPPDPPKIGRGAKFRCLVCRETCPDQHIKNEGALGRLGVQLMAVVAEGKRERVYLPPDSHQVSVAESAQPEWGPEQELAHDPRALWCIPYGLRRFRDLFTPRQLVSLTTFSDLVSEARQQALRDGAPEEYGTAIATYLAFALSKMADRGSTICTWFTERDSTRNTFARQGIPMTWDFAELNTLLDGTGSFSGAVEWTAESLDGIPSAPIKAGSVSQLDATSQISVGRVISTDPPYYDNIGYAVLSDFFYVWLRYSLSRLYPSLFSTLLVPKAQELVATPYRFEGSKERAQQFFEDGFVQAFTRMKEAQKPGFPLTVFYAFRECPVDRRK